MTMSTDIYIMVYRQLSSVQNCAVHEICTELHRATQFMVSVVLYGNLCCAMILIDICGKKQSLLMAS